MANVKSFPNNQDEYIGAEYVMKWLHGRTSGVFAAENNAAVSAVQNEMAVNVSDGLGWMANAGKDGIVWWNDHEAVNGVKLKLAIDAADSTLNRVDRIIVEWKTTNYVDHPEIKVLKGSLSSTAVAPTLTNNSTIRQISLAQVSIAAGTTAITASMVTDERLDASVCGLVTESISIDTSTMQNQFEALLKSIQNELQNLNAGTAALLKTGDTMQGTLDMGGNRIQNVATPENESDAVNKKFLDDALANFESGVSMELLWENASTISSFAAQTISIPSLADYDYVLVLFSHADVLGRPDGVWLCADTSSVWTNNVQPDRVIRTFVINSDNIQFQGGYLSTRGANATTDNTQQIPKQVIGIKKGVN